MTNKSEDKTSFLDVLSQEKTLSLEEISQYIPEELDASWGNSWAAITKETIDQLVKANNQYRDEWASTSHFRRALVLLLIARMEVAKLRLKTEEKRDEKHERSTMTDTSTFGQTQVVANRTESSGSTVWCRVGAFEVCTWQGEDQQQRAELQLRGWESLGRPACESIRPANSRDPLKPSVTLIMKLGSIAVHVDEMLSSTGHHFDEVTVRNLLKDYEVVEWMREMDSRGLLPLKRG